MRPWTATHGLISSWFAGRSSFARGIAAARLLRRLALYPSAMRLGSFLIVLGAMLLASSVVVPYVREYSAVDTCLDRGGSFDYEKGACVMQGPPTTHPVIPFRARHRAATPVLIAGGALFVLGLCLHMWKRPR